MHTVTVLEEKVYTAVHCMQLNLKDGHTITTISHTLVLTGDKLVRQSPSERGHSVEKFTYGFLEFLTSFYDLGVLYFCVFRAIVLGPDIAQFMQTVLCMDIESLHRGFKSC